jgi:hypothetical protein
MAAKDPADSPLTPLSPRASADAALHRAEVFIAQGDTDRALGYLRAAKAG